MNAAMLGLCLAAVAGTAGCAAPRFRPVVRRAVSSVEEVAIVQKAPLVSTTTANVKEVYDLDLVEAMPSTDISGARFAKPDQRLVIDEQGQRDASLTVSGHRLDGQVRGAPVHVQVKPVEIQGHMAGEPVWIWMRGREAQGHIGGHDVAFSMIETPTGHLLRGTAVGHTVRLEESHGVLSWLPSCERPLVRLPPGASAHAVYQGTCASGRRIRVSVPDTLDHLPPLPRLILLSLLLTDREEQGTAPRLFPAKETP